MKKNVGKTDKIIRLSIAAVLIGLYATNVVQGTLGLVALGVAALMALSAAVSFCPAYLLLGSKSCGTACCGGCKSDDKKEA
ncbi:MAG TPA: DUF2892 domain-containing protein [Alphaproteobacteria bacterium]|nr:DUF2892 domain-containing protein [Alphaproteobacteria bacterium]